MRHSRFPLILCALFFAGGCHDPVAPLVVPSTYVARAVNGAPLPVAAFGDPTNPITLLADTIYLYPLGIAERVSIYRDPARAEPTVGPANRVQHAYEVRGNVLGFRSDCPINANCLGAPEGLLSADRRKLLLRMWPSGPVARYDRVTPP